MEIYYSCPKGLSIFLIESQGKFDIHLMIKQALTLQDNSLLIFLYYFLVHDFPLNNFDPNK